MLFTLSTIRGRRNALGRVTRTLLNLSSGLTNVRETWTVRIPPLPNGASLVFESQLPGAEVSCIWFALDYDSLLFAHLRPLPITFSIFSVALASLASMTVAALLHHQTLNATLTPAERELHYEFRGIKYAAIPARWEHSQPIDSWNGQVLDCTKFG